MRKEREYCVYLMASKSGTLYIGVTGDLEWRVYEHKNGLIDGFTKKYGCKKLVYFEEFQYIDQAIDREKQIKKWRREKKMNLIKTINPKWKDLAEDWEEGKSVEGIPPLRSE